MENLDELLKCNFEIQAISNEKDNKIILKGTKINLLVGLSMLTNQLKNSGIKKEDIKEAVEVGLQEDEEIENKAKEKLKTLLDKLF